MTWFNLVNTMTGSSETFGTVISSHRTAHAAFAAARRAQPNQRFNPGAYVPTVVTISDQRLDRGKYVPRTAQRPDPKLWEDYAYECFQKGVRP